MRFILYCLIAVLTPAFASSQEIVGLWKGTLLNDSTGHTLEYELVINKEKGKYTGFSHTWFLINDQKYYGIKKVKVRIAKDGKVVVQDGELIENNYPVSTPKDVSQLNVLDLARLGDESVLSGVFVTNQTKEHRELTGQVKLKKVSLFTQSDLMQYLEKGTGQGSLTSTK